MYALTIAIASLAGLAVGMLARPLVFACSVPEDEPPRSHCPGCGESLPRRSSAAALLGRCGTCGQRIPPAALLPEVAGAAAFAGIAASGSTGWLAAAQYWFAACGLALVLVDVAVHRLPDVLTRPAVLGTLALLAGGALGRDWSSFVRAVLAAAAVTAVYLVLTFAGLGGGDLKLAPAIGALLGWSSWSAVLQGAAAGFVLIALFGLAQWLLRRAKRGDELAFGPFMVCGALAVSVLT
ncbi:A24 family peptidase [Kitasatospora sp. NBC_00240]|uniref:prepilin peptidase n=1 Tax=Kitasatospora sp. NBC_00240 TaxID=2903567 RepID=UPI0022524083|nr:A24 family peptidase [Kitasatospora sp. NBC_00240]MCX5215703.1 A24 family peptidase [Kitasatospora sp. NBC_00240]